ncbi:MAG: 16S rRNA (guanine(966)-N(2))-methyltransferase RsmD [Ruminococcus sp.]|nr:16S rRNA (guanine(966)-N(2))-methyltransferase RsmD [Ruminococcus sp.]
MRVISGIERGRKLKTLDGQEVRPTTDKVKEAIFSSLQFEISGSVVLDLFAGSGQMGIEALSRGAVRAIFVDHSPRSLAVTRENLEVTHFTERAQIYQTEAEAFLQMLSSKIDIAILDPPYRKGIIKKILPLLISHMQKDGWIVCEHETALVLPNTMKEWSIQKERKYGTITVTIYKRGEA